MEEEIDDKLPANSPKHFHVALSPSVQSAMERVGDGPITAVAFVRAIFELHEEYAGGAAKSLQLTDTPTMRPAQEWLSEVLTLFVFSPSGPPL